MDFRPLSEVERSRVVHVLRGNVENGRAILMDRHDTSLRGTSDEIPDAEVISAIKSVPRASQTRLVASLGLRPGDRTPPRWLG